jgi:hypothetical protein
VKNNGYYSGWYTQGDEITPTTNSTITYLIFVYSFSGWHDKAGTVIQTPFSVSAPANYTAEYTLSGISFSCFPGCLSQTSSSGDLPTNKPSPAMGQQTNRITHDGRHLLSEHQILAKTAMRVV